MTTKYIESELPTNQVIEAMQYAHFVFAEQQKMFSLSMPFIFCASLLEPEPEGMNFDFADWRNEPLQIVWSVKIDKGATVTLQSKKPETHVLYDIFFDLLKEEIDNYGL